MVWSYLPKLQQRFLCYTDYLLQAAFPEPCQHCGEKFPLHGILCESCQAKIIESARNKVLPQAYYETQYLLSYQGVIKSLFTAAKFAQRRRATTIIYRLAHPALAALCTSDTLFVPMPSSRRLLLSLLENCVPRAYIAKGIFHVRKRITEKQNKYLSEAGRFRRIRETLHRSKKNLPEAVRYILCDDVLTTGATLGQAAWLFEQNGIARERILLWALCYQERKFDLPEIY